MRDLTDAALEAMARAHWEAASAHLPSLLGVWDNVGPADQSRLIAAMRAAWNASPAKGLVESLEGIDEFTLVILKAVNYADRDNLDAVYDALKAARQALLTLQGRETT